MSWVRAFPSLPHTQIHTYTHTCRHTQTHTHTHTLSLSLCPAGVSKDMARATSTPLFLYSFIGIAVTFRAYCTRYAHSRARVCACIKCSVKPSSLLTIVAHCLTKPLVVCVCVCVCVRARCSWATAIKATSALTSSAFVRFGVVVIAGTLLPFFGSTAERERERERVCVCVYVFVALNAHLVLSLSLS